MSTARQKLIDTFKEDIWGLNEYFINDNFSDIDPVTKVELYKNYSLETITKLLGRRFGKMIHDQEDLMRMLELLFEKGYSNIITDKGNGLLYIPMFMYLLRYNPNEVAFFYEMCMKVHLVKDKEALFASEGLRKLEVPFDTSVVDKLELLLLTPEFPADLRTVVNILDYIDYERLVNGNRDNEFYQFLYKAEKDLLAYFSFFAGDSLCEEFIKNREGNTRDYKYSKYSFTNDGLKLMSFYIETKTPLYKNKFLEFKVLEDRLKSSTDIESRKNNMMVAFTYRTYPDSFYDSFDDVDLSIEDLLVFINRYEETGNSLSSRQVNNLLNSYRNRYLAKNGLVDEFNDLVVSVEREFKEFRKTRYAFLPSDFIRYYNNKYPDSNFRSFTFGSDTLLTRDIYEMIINSNNLVGYSELYECNSIREYVSSRNITEVSKITINSDNLEYERKKAIYDKYYASLEEQHFCADFTISYFIRKNVPLEDRALFYDLKEWYDTYADCGWDNSLRVRKRTFNQLEVDINEEFRNSPFSLRYDIVRKYQEYVVMDGVSDLSTLRYFYTVMHAYEKEFIEENGIMMFAKVMGAYNRGEDVFEVLSDLGLSIDDVNLVFGSLGGDYMRQSVLIEKKATADFNIHEEKKKTLIKTEQEASLLKVFQILLSDTESSSLKAFCANHDIDFCVIDKMRDFVRRDSSLASSYEAKLASMKALRDSVHDEDLEWAVDGIVDGVKKPDGTTRPFTYLDFRLGTSVPVSQLIKSSGGAYQSVRKFVRDNKDLTLFKEADVLAEKYVIMVDGKPHEVTSEEKQAVLDFIDVMELPHEVKLYNLIVRNSLNGNLIMGRNDDGKVKIFVKEGFSKK